MWAQVQGGPVSFYRPLFVLWLRLNFILSEMSPWGWHLVSILKHLLVAGFLGLVVWRLLRDRVAALIAATLFALHPAHTESVAWVTVPDPLMSAALLGSLLLYLEYAERMSEQSVTANNPARKSRKHVRNKAREFSNRVAARVRGCFSGRVDDKGNGHCLACCRLCPGLIRAGQQHGWGKSY